MAPKANRTWTMKRGYAAPPKAKSASTTTRKSAPPPRAPRKK